MAHQVYISRFLKHEDTGVGPVVKLILPQTYLSRVLWKVWKVLTMYWSATCRAPQITATIMSGFSAFNLKKEIEFNYHH